MLRLCWAPSTSLPSSHSASASLTASILGPRCGHPSGLTRLQNIPRIVVGVRATGSSRRIKLRNSADVSLFAPPFNNVNSQTWFVLAEGNGANKTGRGGQEQQGHWKCSGSKEETHRGILPVYNWIRILYKIDINLINFILQLIYL